MILANLALARSVNYDGMLQTEAYLTIVIYDYKFFIVQATVQSKISLKFRFNFVKSRN
jgi:hypothetical protein